MLTSWHFGAGGDILGKNMLFFFLLKVRKTEIILQDSSDPSKGPNFVWFTSERVLNKT